MRNPTSSARRRALGMLLLLLTAPVIAHAGSFVTFESGQVRPLALSPDGSRVRVTVKDTGPGISEADQARLFTSFEQVDGSATRKVGGLGLGLSFVRRLADDAGFPLHVSSVEGKGSEFSLDLPTA